MIKEKLIRIALVIALTACLAGNGTQACSVPVFRYALERWSADFYEVVIFHRGALSHEQKSLVEGLETMCIDEELPANLTVNLVDLDADPSPEWLEIWNRQESKSLPAMVLRYPPALRMSGNAWTAPLSQENIKRLVHSPKRAEISKRIIQGDSAVWVLLECGDKSQDDAAEKLISLNLDELVNEIELPEIDPEDIAAGLVDDPEQAVKIDFSVLRLSRTDPAEAALVHMLLGTESDLHNINGPIAFPVFGRGRALYALAGKGIVKGNISEACLFLTGACSCQVKELNPGVDLLMAFNWDEVLSEDQIVKDSFPELMSSAGLAQHAGDATGSLETSSHNPISPETGQHGEDQHFLTGVVVVGTLYLLVLIGVTVVIMRRRS